MKRNLRERSPLAWTLVTATLLLGACEGSNLFEGMELPINTLPQASITAPGVAFAGDTVSITIFSQAPRGLQVIEASLRGAVTRDTVIIAGGTSNTSTIRMGVPGILIDSLVIATARVTDLEGSRSTIAADTIRVF